MTTFGTTTFKPENLTIAAILDEEMRVYSLSNGGAFVGYEEDGDVFNICGGIHFGADVVARLSSKFAA